MTNAPTPSRPAKFPAEKRFVLLKSDGTILLYRRPSKSLLGQQPLSRHKKTRSSGTGAPVERGNSLRFDFLSQQLAERLAGKMLK
jgi:hypothetical protein